MNPPGAKVLATGIALLALGTLLLPRALQAEEGYNPFQVPKKDFYSAVKTVALWPLSSPSDLLERREVSELIELKLRERLEEKGLTVLPSDEIERRWIALSESIGGLVDPVTGEAEDDALESLREILRTELAIRHGVDAIVSPRISSGRITPGTKRTRTAPEDGGPAESVNAWAAAGEPIEWQERPLHNLWMNRPTRVLGQRLAIVFGDTSGVSLYNIMIPLRYTQVHVRGGKERRPPRSLLEHEDRIDEILEALLEDIDYPRE